MKGLGYLLFAILLSSPVAALAQDSETPADAAQEMPLTEGEDPIHDQLRDLRQNVESVIAEKNWDGLSPFLSSRVVVTWLDGTQSHGTDEVIGYLNAKTEGADAIVSQFSLKLEVAELSDLYGQDTAIAYGNATSSFVLRGSDLSIAGPWTATMVREDEQWKLATLSASVGVFDNPLLTWATRLAWIAGIACGLVGLLVGRFLGRRSVATTN